MTRINIGIKPSLLHNKHLLAEHREITRIPNTLKSGRLKVDGIPLNFVLGKGHVKFFIDKQLYLKKRYEELYSECIHRGFKVQYYGDSWDDIDYKYLNDYVPNEKDLNLIMERLEEKLKGMNKNLILT